MADLSTPVTPTGSPVPPVNPMAGTPAVPAPNVAAGQTNVAPVQPVQPVVPAPVQNAAPAGVAEIRRQDPSVSSETVQAGQAERQRALEAKLQAGGYDAGTVLQYNQLMGKNDAARQFVLGDVKSQALRKAGKAPVEGTTYNPAEQAKLDATNAQLNQKIQETQNARVDQINKNLQEGLANNKQAFGTVESFKQAYGYDQKPANEQKILDNFWAQNAPKNKDQLFDVLQAGGKIGNSPEEQKALASYSLVKTLSNGTSDQLMAAVKRGSITEGSKEFEALKQTNPAAVQDYFKKKNNATSLDQINNLASGAYNTIKAATKPAGMKDTGTEPAPVIKTAEDHETDVSKKFLDANPDIAKDPAKLDALSTALAQNDQVQQTRTDLATLNKEYTEIQNSKAALARKVRDDLKGSGATQNYIDSVVAFRLQGINERETQLSTEIGVKNAVLQASIENRQFQIQQLQWQQNYQLDQAKLQWDKDALQKQQDFQMKMQQYNFQKVESLTWEVALVNPITKEKITVFGSPSNPTGGAAYSAQDLSDVASQLMKSGKSYAEATKQAGTLLSQGQTREQILASAMTPQETEVFKQTTDQVKNLSTYYNNAVKASSMFIDSISKNPNSLVSALSTDELIKNLSGGAATRDQIAQFDENGLGKFDKLANELNKAINGYNTPMKIKVMKDAAVQLEDSLKLAISKQMNDIVSPYSDNPYVKNLLFKNLPADSRTYVNKREIMDSPESLGSLKLSDLASKEEITGSPELSEILSSNKNLKVSDLIAPSQMSVWNSMVNKNFGSSQNFHQVYDSNEAAKCQDKILTKLSEGVSKDDIVKALSADNSIYKDKPLYWGFLKW